MRSYPSRHRTLLMSPNSFCLKLPDFTPSDSDILSKLPLKFQKIFQPKCYCIRDVVSSVADLGSVHFDFAILNVNRCSVRSKCTIKLNHTVEKIETKISQVGSCCRNRVPFWITPFSFFQLSCAFKYANAKFAPFFRPVCVEVPNLFIVIRVQERVDLPTQQYHAADHLKFCLKGIRDLEHRLPRCRGSLLAHFAQLSTCRNYGNHRRQKSDRSSNKPLIAINPKFEAWRLYTCLGGKKSLWNWACIWLDIGPETRQRHKGAKNQEQSARRRFRPLIHLSPPRLHRAAPLSSASARSKASTDIRAAA